MKVILVNGSPRKKGCTYTALAEVAKTLEKESIETEIVHIGNKPIAGCLSCRLCIDLGKCVIDDGVNDFLEKYRDADGFIFGSPVYYAGANGSLVSFLDRLFYSDACSGVRSFYLKPGAAIVSARRAGTTTALDQLNKYFSISEMPIISSRYWNMVHGMTPEDVVKDEEGMQIMRTLGRNMAYHLKCKEAAKQKGIELPEQEERIGTNFIR